ncbi:MAG: uridine diphosphate-N-acetylglucosamine-binding protein YvcK [Candidatus Aenigmatarchaeota archaeon]
MINNFNIKISGKIKVVAIGGGNGQANLLKSLKILKRELEAKEINLEIVAITNCFDSGGSTGRIRKQYGGIAFGDIRRSIGALAKDESIEKILEMRFSNGDFKGHAFGNIMLLSLYKCFHDSLEAIKKACEIFKTEGKVLPPSIDESYLFAKLEDGSIIKGEDKIDELNKLEEIKARILEVWLEPNANAIEEAKEEIKSANFIILSPGDIYSSLISTLLPKGIKETILLSKAKKLIYVCNLVARNEYNVSVASELIKIIENYAGRKIDVIICDNSKIPLNRRIEIDDKNIKCKIIKEDIASRELHGRHDPSLLKNAILKAIVE